MSIATLRELETEPTTVWPTVAVDGDLERARPEWLHTNGAGAFATSTIARMHTRRYHGLLVAALDPPQKRHVVLSHMDAMLEVAGERAELGTHQFPNVLPTGGFHYLTHFASDPLPRWTYSACGGRFEETLALVRGQRQHPPVGARHIQPVLGVALDDHRHRLVAVGVNLGPQAHAVVVGEDHVKGRGPRQTTQPAAMCKAGR